MRRNNYVFLMGTVVHYSTNMLPVDGEPTPVMELQIQTDSPDQGGRHRIFVTGRQALELYHFIQASKDEPLEITVLGWLHSQTDSAVVMASRVTAVAPRSVRDLAIQAIQKEKQLPFSSPA
jgi:hypothetical protein